MLRPTGVVKGQFERLGVLPLPGVEEDIDRYIWLNTWDDDDDITQDASAFSGIIGVDMIRMTPGWASHLMGKTTPSVLSEANGTQRPRSLICPGKRYKRPSYILSTICKTSLRHSLVGLYPGSSSNPSKHFAIER